MKLRKSVQEIAISITIITADTGIITAMANENKETIEKIKQNDNKILNLCNQFII